MFPRWPQLSARWSQAAVVFCLSVVAAIANGAERDDFREADLQNDTYGRTIRHILGQGYRKDVVLRMLTLGAFGGEHIVGIRRVGSSYRAFTVESEPDIWKEIQKPVSNFSRIRSSYYERPIPEPLVRRMTGIWCHALRDRRNYRNEKERRMLLYLDSTQFYFFVRCDSGKVVTANTSNFLGPVASELINIGNKATGGPTQRKFEADLERAIRRAEEKLRLP